VEAGNDVHNVVMQEFKDIPVSKGDFNFPEVCNSTPLRWK
jgi:hypothetical protein